MYSSSAQYCIRKYTSGDKSMLLEIVKELIPAYFAPAELQDLEHYLENEIEDYYIMLAGAEIIGAGGINYEGNTAKISWDFLRPDWQGRGAGKQLLQFRIHQILSYSSIKNIVVRTSQMTYLFYEKYGFVLQSIQKDYWADGYDMYYMIWKGNVSLD